MRVFLWETILAFSEVKWTFVNTHINVTTAFAMGFSFLTRRALFLIVLGEVCFYHKPVVRNSVIKMYFGYFDDWAQENGRYAVKLLVFFSYGFFGEIPYRISAQYDFLYLGTKLTGNVLYRYFLNWLFI